MVPAPFLDKKVVTLLRLIHPESHQQLLEAQGFYADLLNSQFIEKAEADTLSSDE